MNTRSAVKTSIVLLAVPFSLVGAFWFLYILGYNMSVSVWVGLIALAGLDAETGVVMLLYLDHAWDKFSTAGRMNSMDELQAAVIEGAVQRTPPPPPPRPSPIRRPRNSQPLGNVRTVHNVRNSAVLRRKRPRRHAPPPRRPRRCPERTHGTPRATPVQLSPSQPPKRRRRGRPR